MGTEEIDSGKPLFLVRSIRVYRPSEAPEKARENACAKENEYLEPGILTERLVESFSEEFERHGLSLRNPDRRSGRGPFWQLDCQGSGVGIALVCDDFAKYCEARKIPGERETIQALQDSGDLALCSKAGGRDGTRTEDDSEDTFRDDDAPAVLELAKRIREDWPEYLRDLARRMFESLNVDRDYLTSWEAVADSLDANGQGIDDAGERHDLNECRTEGSGYNVGDV
jgi:hypothetical protein